MRIIVSFVILLMLCTACGPKPITEDEFKLTWKTYLTREFEESFDEKQSTAQKEKLLREITHSYNINYTYFLLYMKIKHPEKYKRVFEIKPE